MPAHAVRRLTSGKLTADRTRSNKRASRGRRDGRFIGARSAYPTG